MRTRTVLSQAALAAALVFHVSHARGDEPAPASASASASVSLSAPGSTPSAPSEPAAKQATPASGEDSTRKVIAASAIAFGTGALALWVVELARVGSLHDEQDRALQSVPSGVDACTVGP